MNQHTIKTILRVDSSARRADSLSRQLADEVVRRLQAQHPGARVEHVDLADGLTHIDADWIGATFTPPEQRDAAQREHLAASDAAVASLTAADAVVVSAPIYNFSVPSTLRAWIDQVCRPGLTFRYTANGPQGLLDDRPVYLAMASGGVPFGSPVDFASSYLRQVFRFIGIEDVRLCGAAGVEADTDGALGEAFAQLGQWLPAPTGEAA